MKVLFFVLFPLILFAQTKVVSSAWVKARIADSTAVVRTEFKAVDDSLASDIAGIEGSDTTSLSNRIDLKADLTITDSLAEDIAALPTVAEVQTQIQGQDSLQVIDGSAKVYVNPNDNYGLQISRPNDDVGIKIKVDNQKTGWIVFENQDGADVAEIEFDTDGTTKTFEIGTNTAYPVLIRSNGNNTVAITDTNVVIDGYVTADSIVVGTSTVKIGSSDITINDTTITEKLALKLNKADSTLYATQTDISAKLNANLAGYTAYTTPLDADIIIVQKESDNALGKVELSTLPVADATTDAINNATTGFASNQSIEYLQTQINDLQQEMYDSIAVLKALIEGSGNPFPNAPSNLVATGTTTDIGITWTASISNHDSTAIFRSGSIADVVSFVEIGKVDSGITTYTDTDITTNLLYSYYAKAVKDNIYSSASNTDTAFSYQASGGGLDVFQPDLAGLLDGTATSDFSYQEVETGNAFAVDAGWYKLTYDSVNVSNDAFAWKTFTGQSDSVFVGARVFFNRPDTTFNASEEHTVLAIIDTVSGLNVAQLMMEDGNGDRVVDRWEYRVYNGGTQTTGQSSNNFAGEFKNIQISVRFGDGTGSVIFTINDTTLITLSDLTNHTLSANAVMIGNNETYNSADQIVKNDILYDEVYADSRGIQVGDWWEASILDTVESEGVNGWFVDADATGANNGTSWTDAWESFSSVTFGSMASGDTLYISGGADTTIYTEPQITIPETADNITITNGISASHSGKVIINSTSTNSAVYVTGVIDGFAITDITIDGTNPRYGIYISGGFDSLKIENCDITGFREFGISTNGVPDTTGTRKNLWLVDNYIETREEGNEGGVQIDGLSIQNVLNLFVIGNTILNYNQGTDDTHNDFMQGSYNTNQYYFNNFFGHFNTVNPSGNNGVQHGGESAGDFYFANNIFFSGLTQSRDIWAEATTSRVRSRWGKWYVVNNTHIGVANRKYFTCVYDNATFKNNLYWSVGTSSLYAYWYQDLGRDLAGTTMAAYEIENNNFYRLSGHDFMEGTGAFSVPASNEWLLSTSYSPTLAGFTYSPSTYSYPCPYSTDPTDYYITSGSTREWEQGEMLEEADFPTDAQAPAWFKAWDYINKYRNGNARTQWDIGVR